MTRNRIASTTAALLMACIVSAPRPSHASKAPGAPSAQDAWNQARDAYRRGDYKTYITTVVPEMHDECICQLSRILSGAIGYELLEPGEDIRKLNRILRRYGVLNAEAPAFRADSLSAPGLWGSVAIGRIRNKVGFYHDTTRYLRRHKVGPKLPTYLTLDLTNLKTDGPRATATLGGRPRLRPEATRIAFEKRGESWFIEPPRLCLIDKPAVDQP